MYLTFDLEGPVYQRYTANNNQKRRLLGSNGWPTHTIDTGHVVMSSFIFYQNDAVVATDNAKNIYKLLGTDVTTLEEGEYDGVENAYLYLDPFNTADVLFTEPNINTLLKDFETDRAEILLRSTGARSSQPASYYTAQLELAITNQVHNSMKFNTDSTQVLALALSDIEGDIFDIKLEYTNTSIKNNRVDGSTRRVDEEYMSFFITYTKKATTYVSDVYLNRLTANAATLTLITPSSNVAVNTSIATQLLDLFKDISDIPDSGFVVSDSAGNKFVSKAGLQAVSHRTFRTTFAALIDNGYVAKEVAFWKKVLIVIVAIATIVLTILSAGSSAYAGYYAFFAVVTALIGTGLQMYWGDNGDVNAAYMMGKYMKVVQVVGFVVGITAIIKSLSTAIASSAATGASIVTTKTVSIALNISNQSFSFYAKNEGEKDAAELAKKSAAIELNQRRMDAMPTPKKYDLERWDFESYNFLELNEEMQQVPFMMTQGKIHEMTHKYYH